MARTRVRAARRKEQDALARVIANGVYTIARDLGPHIAERPDGEASYGRVRHVDARFPRPVLAPLVFMSEMIAVAVAKKHDLDRARADELALYLMQGVQESMVAMVQSFDSEHFEAWSAAAALRDG